MGNSSIPQLIETNFLPAQRRNRRLDRRRAAHGGGRDPPLGSQEKWLMRSIRQLDILPELLCSMSNCSRLANEKLNFRTANSPHPRLHLRVERRVVFSFPVQSLRVSPSRRLILQKSPRKRTFLFLPCPRRLRQAWQTYSHSSRRSLFGLSKTMLS